MPWQTTGCVMVSRLGAEMEALTPPIMTSLTYYNRGGFSFIISLGI